MRKSLFFILSFLFLTALQAQILDPVKWTTSVQKISSSEYDLVIKASIQNKWHLYAQYVPENGPIPTTFTFKTTPEFKLIGKPTEEAGRKTFDPVFEMEIKYFEKTATFKQRIRVLNDKEVKIKGEVEFMVCDDESCLAPTVVDLNFAIPAENGRSAASAEILNSVPNVAYSDSAVDFNQTTEKATETVAQATETVASQGIEKKTDRNLWTIFIIAFFSGFAALLTPCVFPMIPMTVSFFTKQSMGKSQGIKNAIIYGLSIILIYVFLGLLVSAIFGADALNALSTNVWFNLIFFLLLVVFAISFLGAFEIVLPSSWGTKVDAQADRGGIIGIFFMALALAIVSFSCTGPIVGTLLVEAAAGGSQIGPIIGMLGFSLALAIPFALFAAFPGWLNSLPKSGGWLNTVKVVLGFLELALAFKFLSNADLVLQLHWLEREVFLSIWITIFLLLAFYLFGKIQLPHDSPTSNISVGRFGLGMVSLAFAIYMIPGLWGAPLNLISAFPPAQHYSESPYGVGYSNQNSGMSEAEQESLPDGAHLMPPHNIMAFNDYDLGLAYAKKVNKPVMLDFTGHACVNCRKMEQNVWATEQILPILKNEVVLISLYVDDKRPLPAGAEIDSKLNQGKKLKYIGQKWSEFQILRYGANAQPFYVLMGHDEKNLIAPTAYTPNVQEYHDWLKKGISNFK